MPVLPESANADNIYLRSPLGVGELPRVKAPQLHETLGAAFRLDSMPYNVVRSFMETSDKEDPDYNPYEDPDISDDIKDNYGDRLTFVRSRGEAQATVLRIGQENKDNETLNASPSLLAFSARMAAGVLDPTIAIPGGTIYRAARGAAALRSMASVGMAAGGQALLQEEILRELQETRRPEDIAFTVATSTLLGGILGAGASKLLSRAERQSLEAGMDRFRADLSTGTSNRSAGAAEAARDLTIAPIVPEVISKAYRAGVKQLERIPVVGTAIGKVAQFPEYVATKSGPMLRIMMGDSIAAKKGLVEISEVPLLTKANLEGMTNTDRIPLEREVRGALRQAEFYLTKEAERAFQDYRGIKGSFVKTRAVIQNRTGKSDQLTFDAFMEEVDSALRNGDVHDIPEINALAQKFRQVIDAPYKRAVEHGLLEEGRPLGAKSYAPRRVIREALVANKPQFIDNYLTYRRADHAEKLNLRDQIAAEWKRLEEARTAGNADLEKAILDILADLVSRWHGKSAKGDVEEAVKNIIGYKDKSETELADEAEQTFNQYLGTPDGRLPKDDPTYGGMAVPSAMEGRGPLQARVNPMPDELLLPFLDRQPLRYTMHYLRSMLSDIGMFERFGDFEGTAALQAIDNEASLAAKNVTPAERQAIYKKRDRAISDFAGVRDRLKGVFGFSTDTVQQNIGKAAQSLGDFDVMTNMGGAGLAQLTDMANVVARHAFHGSLAPALASLTGFLTRMAPGTFQKARAEWGSVIGATEVLLSSRGREIADMGDIYQPATKFARIMRTGAEATMVLSGTSLMTDWGRTVSAIATSTKILKAAKALSTGKASKKQMIALAESGINPGMARKIWNSFNGAEGGHITPEGAYLTNTASWTDVDARKQFEAALGRNVDIDIVTPGEEKPLAMSTPVIGLIAKYKSFVAAANTRILLANLQRRDASALSGLIAAIGLGMVVSAVRSEISGVDTSKRRTQDWIKEGLDRSGWLGWLGETNAMAAQATRGSLDLYRIIGADKPLTRYASRSVLGSALGPIGGKIEGLSQITGAIGTGEWTASDVRRLRQLVPFQNLFYIRTLIDEVENSAKATFGIESRPN